MAPLITVALLAEGVDRNKGGVAIAGLNVQVALLAEGVDRNTLPAPPCLAWHRSPSSRRAWIEILSAFRPSAHPRVALLAEGVDRNNGALHGQAGVVGRPPRGGRG